MSTGAILLQALKTLCLCVHTHICKEAEILLIVCDHIPFQVLVFAEQPYQVKHPVTDIFLHYNSSVKVLILSPFFFHFHNEVYAILKEQPKSRTSSL